MFNEEPIPKSKYWNTVDDGVSVICSLIITFLFIVVKIIVTVLVFPLYLIGKLK